MGSGLCRRTNGMPRAMGVDGLYRKIVFNYAKQWTRCSDRRPKSDKKNTKHNKNKKKKPIISGPYPVDPDRLEGDKWRYVILTRLDTEPPPERPPRTKRRGQETRGSIRRRRRSCGRGSGRRPRPPSRRQTVDRQEAAQLMELVLEAYRRGPVGRSGGGTAGRPQGVTGDAAAAESAAASSEPQKSSPADVAKPAATFPWIAWPSVGRGRNGFFVSIGRARTMAHSLLSM